MSLFGSLMGDFEDDPIFGHHMRSMRQMNNMMNSMFGDPFGAFDSMNGLSAITNGGFGQQQNRQMSMSPFGGGLMSPFGFPSMPNMNRLLSMDGADGQSFCSSSVISMSHGPDGRPQVYQATSSTKTGPGGIRETQRTVQDSRSGVKKMAIGHHIGDRAHIIEREQNLRSGQQEERQDFINLDEDEAEDFDREFTQRSRQGMRLPNAITEVTGNAAAGTQRRQLPAILPAQNNTSSNSDEKPSSDEPVISEPITTSPPPQSLSSSSTSHSRRAYRNDKTNRYCKNQTIGTSNLATARRPLRTPTSSPLTMGTGIEFMSSRSSKHPHPYNVSSPSGRRHHRSSMKNTSNSQNHQSYVQIEELPDDYEEGAATSSNVQQQK